VSQALTGLGTAAFWGAVAGAVWLVSALVRRAPWREAATWLAVSGALAAVLPWPKSSGPAVPVVWPVLPLPGLALATFATLAGWRAVRAWQDVRPAERAGHAKVALGWAALCGGALVWLIRSGEQGRLLTGTVPFTPQGAAVAAALLGTGLLLAAASARWAKVAGLGWRFAAHSALLSGCLVFSLPLAWMFASGFKDSRDFEAYASLVPRVQPTVPLDDPDRQLVEAVFEGKAVLAGIQGRAEDGRLRLQVERPFPLRGWEFVADEADVSPVPRRAGIVALSVDGVAATGAVVQSRPDGGQTVRIVTPASLAGRTVEAAMAETKPLWVPGLRGENYAEALEWLPEEAQGGWAYLRSTLWLVLTNVIGTLLSCSLVAYGFARFRFPGRSALFGLLLATLMLPPAVTLLPRFLVWRSLGAFDTLVPLWLGSFFGSAFTVFLLRQFFQTVPREFDDAARIDGCGPLRTWWSVLLPQVRPALTVVGIWTFMGAWNDFMGPLLYLSSPEKMPVSYALALFASDRGADLGLTMAFATMTTLPLIAVFLVGQRAFVDGVQLSGFGGR
jgi:multiple sugar transport system permease protein